MPSGRFPDGGFLLRRRVARDYSQAWRAQLIHRDALTVNGKTIWENCESAPIGILRSFALWKNLSSNMAALPCCEAIWRRMGRCSSPLPHRPHLMRHSGRAVVFENIEHYKERIDNPDLEVTRVAFWC